MHTCTHSGEDLRGDAYITLVSSVTVISLILLWVTALSYEVDWSNLSSEHVLNSQQNILRRGSGSIYYPSRPSFKGRVFFILTLWCYSSGIQSLSSNLSPQHHAPSHLLYSPMHTLKRTGGPKVGFGRGVGVCVGHRGVYTAPHNMMRRMVSGFDPLWMLLSPPVTALSFFFPSSPPDWNQAWLSTNTQVK